MSKIQYSSTLYQNVMSGWQRRYLNIHPSIVLSSTVVCIPVPVWSRLCHTLPDLPAARNAEYRSMMTSSPHLISSHLVSSEVPHCSITSVIELSANQQVCYTFRYKWVHRPGSHTGRYLCKLNAHARRQRQAGQGVYCCRITHAMNRTQHNHAEQQVCDGCNMLRTSIDMIHI